MGTIAIQEPLPGPRARQVLAQQAERLPAALASSLPTVVAEGHGAVVTDVDGNRLIDLSGGFGCLAVGHSHPHVVEAIQRQAERFLHTDFSVLPYASYIELADRLAKLAPGSSPKKVALFNSGAEAVENAIKIARQQTGRPALLAFEGAFHGRTMGALTLTSQPSPYKVGFGPFLPEVYRVPFPNPYRSQPPQQLTAQTLETLERMLHTVVDPRTIAAVVVEPIQGEGGFVVPPSDFLPALRSFCDAHGFLLIVDEIQTGYGRTGTFFACEQYGVEPDLLTVGKSIAAGLPLSAVVGRSTIMDGIVAGSIGGTYVGNPVACAAALAVLDVFESEGLVARAQLLGQRLWERLSAWQRKYPLIGDIRGIGAMRACELVLDRNTRQPAPQQTAAILQKAAQRGVILAKAGIYGNVIRFLMPLVTPLEVLDEALDVVESALAEAESNRGSR